MTKTCCPKCKSSTELSVELKRSFELKWDARHDEYIVGESVDGFSSSTYEDDSEVTCACGWSGRFDELKPTTEKYRVVLILDVSVEEHGPIDEWNWKEELDLFAHESVTVDGVNKL